MHENQILTLMILRNSISLRAFSVYMENYRRLKFHFGQNDQIGIQARVKLTSAQLI